MTKAARRTQPDLHEPHCTARNDPAQIHRVAVTGSGPLDSLPHNGAIASLLALCSLAYKEGHFDIVMVAIEIALADLIVLGSTSGTF